MTASPPAWSSSAADSPACTPPRRLRAAPVDVTVVDRTNYHLFQPMLYQVATAALDTSDIASPIRSILRRQRNTEVLMAEVVGRRRGGTDAPARGRECAAVSTISCSHPVSGTPTSGTTRGNGSRPGSRPRMTQKRFGGGCCSPSRRAEREPDAEKRRALLTFVVVGGGPTGWRWPGRSRRFGSSLCAATSGASTPGPQRVMLLEGGRQLLPSYPRDARRRRARGAPATSGSRSEPRRSSRTSRRTTSRPDRLAIPTHTVGLGRRQPGEPTAAVARRPARPGRPGRSCGRTAPSPATRRSSCSGTPRPSRSGMAGSCPDSVPSPSSRGASRRRPSVGTSGEATAGEFVYRDRGSWP